MPAVSRNRHLPLTPWTILPTLAHVCLLTFTMLLILKLEGTWGTSWWFTFCPLWLFHAIMSRCTCSMPAPATPYDRQWSPCHSLFTLPLILSFELLLCCYLSAVEVSPHTPPVPLAIVFAPLLLLEFAVLLDNFRMCIILMPGEDDISDEALWETLPHFAVSVSMVFFIAATIFTVLKLSNLQDEMVDGIDWWTLLVDILIGEFFAFLLCFKWANPHQPPAPVVHHQSTPAAADAETPLLGERSPSLGRGEPGEGATSSGATSARAENPRSPPSVASSDDNGLDLQCGAPEVGGHLMKIGLVAFEVVLCMRLEGGPKWACELSLWTLFSPLLLVQAASLLSALGHLLEYLLLRYAPTVVGSTFSETVREHDPFMFSTRGMRLASWWCKEDEVREERRSLMDSLYTGYQTFDPTPTEYVKKMRKGELKHEVLRLQSALVDQGETLKSQRQELDRVQQEKILCRVCFEREISLVLLPCRHRVLCTQCADKCKHCPICRRYIAEKMAVFDV